MLSASLIQLEYASKQWKSTFSYSQFAKRFQKTTCPHKRSPYLLWLCNQGGTVLGNLQPCVWAMFRGDIVESLNYVFKDNFLTTSSPGGGRKATKEENDEAMLRHAHKGISFTRRCHDGTGGGATKMST